MFCSQILLCLDQKTVVELQDEVNYDIRQPTSPHRNRVRHYYLWTRHNLTSDPRLRFQEEGERREHS
jgi:hypothetical protein